MPRRFGDGDAAKKALTASMAPASVVAEGGTIMAGGNGPVKGILIAGVVIEDASSPGGGLGEKRRRKLRGRGNCVRARFGWRVTAFDPVWVKLCRGLRKVFLGLSFLS